MADQAISESIRQSLSGFDGVWQRVTATQDSFSEEAALQSLIQDTWQLARRYTSLTRQFSSADRATISAHAAQCASQAQRLRAEYFIVTGQVYTPAPTQTVPGGRLDRLRQQMLDALTLAQRCEKAATQTKYEALSEQYKLFSAQLHVMAQEDRQLLIHAFF
jgi:hypothetical protein